MNAEAFVYTLAHSKTNQRGELRPEDVKPLADSAAAAITEWLAVLKAHGVPEGPIFRRIRKGGHLGEPLAPAAVRDIVKELRGLAAPAMHVPGGSGEGRMQGLPVFVLRPVARARADQAGGRVLRTGGNGQEPARRGVAPQSQNGLVRRLSGAYVAPIVILIVMPGPQAAIPLSPLLRLVVLV